MKFKVYLLRRAGQRLAWGNVKNGPSYTGELLSHRVEYGGELYQVVTLRCGDPVPKPLVPELYEPVLLGFAPLAFRLRGFERIEGPRGAFAAVQEWHCEPA